MNYVYLQVTIQSYMPMRTSLDPYVLHWNYTMTSLVSRKILLHISGNFPLQIIAYLESRVAAVMVYPNKI